MAVPESIVCTNAHMSVQKEKKKKNKQVKGEDILQCSVNLFTVKEMPPTHPGDRTKALLGHWLCPVHSFSSTAKTHQDKFLLGGDFLGDSMAFGSL